MKTGQIFWGVFLLALGSLFLLTRYELIQSEWCFIWNLWPFLLIIWGCLVIFKNSKVKPIFIVLLALLLAILIFGSFSNLFCSIDFDEVDSKYSTEFSDEYNPGIKYASLELSGGAGLLVIDDTTSNLIEGKAKGRFEDNDFSSEVTDSTAWIECSMNETGIRFFNKRKNVIRLKLNPSPIWDFQFNTGAASSNFDLSQLKTRNVNLNTGASKTTIKFGKQLEKTYVNIEMGVADVDIKIPENSGCKLTGDMVLVAKDIDGFTKSKAGYYVSDNFDAAKNIVVINIDGGVSKIHITRY
ncbi:MAG: DUF5668 domain-containing protein [bacterium]